MCIYVFVNHVTSQMTRETGTFLAMFSIVVDAVFLFQVSASLHYTVYGFPSPRVLRSDWLSLICLDI